MYACKIFMYIDYLRCEKIVPNYAKTVFFMVMTSSMTSQDHLKVGPLYSCLGEVGSGSKLQGQCLGNTCKYCNRLSR